MPSRSSRATSARREASPLQAVHSGYFALHGGTAATARIVDAPTRSGTRPTYPADVAQSRLFAALLLDELDELEGLVAAAERRRRRRSAAGSDDPTAASPALANLHEKIADVRRLLDALDARFPQD
ncbi:hypothetical protein H7K45_00735 [Mycobacterium yunnanensis]|uniref:Uncharacterized protein n=1 Tax=Mycobacterium yunnanensis TaxID=368477 RepID=A0A9X3BRK9_9MYCO|nr:hypothetical protein [Mycobacterium yunnanensis]MCV7419060.1 hypothetical protein [Mycobacterium yunnanensis]